MRTHRAMLAEISRDSDFSVLGLEYRLAPENPFPAPVEDALTAYRWLLHMGMAPGKIVLGGDSAGGGLVVSALVALRYMGEPMPAAGVCLSPWVDMEATGNSFLTNATVDPSVSKERIIQIAKVYLAGKNPRAHWPRRCMPICMACRLCCRSSARSKRCWTMPAPSRSAHGPPGWKPCWKCGTTCRTCGRILLRFYPRGSKRWSALAILCGIRCNRGRRMM